MLSDNEMQDGACEAVQAIIGVPHLAHVIGATAPVSAVTNLPRQQQAGTCLATKPAVPVAANLSGAKKTVVAIGNLPPIPHNEIAGQACGDDHSPDARDGEGQIVGVNQTPIALAPIIAELVLLQRQRRFCIVSQSRCDRSVESFIAQMLGYKADLTPKERVAMFKRASVIRKGIEKGGEAQWRDDNQMVLSLSAAEPIALLSASAREAWDKHRTQVEKRMRKIATTLPGYEFVKAITGFGDLGFAIIIGETGDLSNYATKERVWKRLGLAVIEGERQGRRTNAEEAAKHGYNPKRRAGVWTVADSLFRQQWRGAKEDAPAHALGVYGEIYATRKAHTATREGWTPAHRDNDARRIMAKQLIEDLWKAWRASA